MKKKHNLFKSTPFIFLILILAMILLHFGLTKKVHAQKKSSDYLHSVAASPTTEQITALASNINATIGANTGINVAVDIINLNTDQTQQYGINNTFEAASTAKLITAADYLHCVEQGSARLDEAIDGGTAQHALQQMIVVSDDTAWQALNDYLGHDDLQTYAASLGLTNYNPADNTLTANDIALLLEKLYKGQLLDRADTSMLLGYMAHANYQGYIGAVVPSDAKFYHKAGVLADRIHDAAIIDDGKHPLVLVIFTKNEDDENAASPTQTDIIQRIATATFDTYSIK